MSDDEHAAEGPASKDQREAMEAALKTYSSQVVETWITRKNHGAIAQPDGRGEAFSDCADRIEIFLKTRQGRIINAQFVSQGCGATFACGSAVSELAKGLTPHGALAISADQVVVALGGLPEPNLHCADMAVQALKAAVKDLLRTANEPWKRLYR